MSSSANVPESNTDSCQISLTGSQQVSLCFGIMIVNILLIRFAKHKHSQGLTTRAGKRLLGISAWLCAGLHAVLTCVTCASPCVRLLIPQKNKLNQQPVLLMRFWKVFSCKSMTILKSYKNALAQNAWRAYINIHWLLVFLNVNVVCSASNRIMPAAVSKHHRHSILCSEELQNIWFNSFYRDNIHSAKRKQFRNAAGSVSQVWGFQSQFPQVLTPLREVMEFPVAQCW